MILKQDLFISHSVFKKNRSDLVCNTAKSPKLLGDHNIQYIWLLKGCPVADKCLCSWLENLRIPVQVHNPVFLCILNHAIGRSHSSAVRAK